jgi:hypothetical protein
MVCVETDTPLDLFAVAGVAKEFDPAAGLGLVIDLEGPISILLGLALAEKGFRPVPVIDGSPGPGVSGLGGTWMDLGEILKPDPGTAVDMRVLLRGLCRGAPFLRDLQIGPLASPAFLLDSRRLAGGRTISDSVFDNRWKTFPQDYPSARFLQEKGIRQMVLIQQIATQPQEDLSHVLLRWQESGIRLKVFGTMDRILKDLTVSRPSWFGALWHRALATIGLRRGEFGGFGDWPHGTGGG